MLEMIWGGEALKRFPYKFPNFRVCLELIFTALSQNLQIARGRCLIWFQLWQPMDLRKSQKEFHWLQYPGCSVELADLTAINNTIYQWVCC